jgi:hypothetical protein
MSATEDRSTCAWPGCERQAEVQVEYRQALEGESGTPPTGPAWTAQPGVAPLCNEHENALCAALGAERIVAVTRL